MEEKNKIDFKELTDNLTSFSKQKFNEAKKFTNEKAIPKLKETTENTKEAVTVSISTVTDKVKNTVTEEQMLDVLNKLYIKSIDGIPKVSLPVDDLVNDYISKNDNIEKAAKSLITNSIIKCGTSGFITGFGGFLSMIATLPANITSVMYVQLRMCCAIAKMAGYDIHSDQVQTLIYACLTGSAASDILKQAGIKFGNKFGTAMVKKIPGKTLTAINQKVGFRFITKFGETGTVNLVNVVPVLGGAIGGGIDIASTKIIGNNAYNIFIKGELPLTNTETEETIPDADFKEVEDIDTKMLDEAIKQKSF
ncbi:MAG: EcsC family protein [Bacilli bacterium]|nr:EcsC family protein [Bacilli bacterium]